MGIFSRIFGDGGGSYETAPVYLDLRRQVVELAERGRDASAERIAVLMETGMEEACYSLVAHVDGTASLYFSNGGGVIGGGQHPNGAQTAKDMVALAARYEPELRPAREQPLPKPGTTRFYLIKPGEILGGEFDEQELGNDRSPLSPLFHKGHELIAVIRHVTEFRESEEPLTVAVFDDATERAKELIGEGADPNTRSSRGTPALAMAVTAGSAQMVDLLLAAGADANAIVPEQGDVRDAPLLNFAATRSPELVDRLLRAGARLDASDASGLSALMTAAYVGHVECLGKLIEAGAPLEQRDESGYTALMFAANSTYLGCVERLVEAGADVEAADNDHSTPIMFAAQNGQNEMVTLLLDRGADPGREGDHGYSAFTFARQNGHTQTLRLLEATLSS